MQQVVLPSLWPRKQNTRGPAAGEDENEDFSPQAASRDLEEEARVEVEEERMEGLRRRARAEERERERGFEMPGAMPGIMVT